MNTGKCEKDNKSIIPVLPMIASETLPALKEATKIIKE
jgi:hypothetical protein